MAYFHAVLLTFTLAASGDAKGVRDDLVGDYRQEVAKAGEGVADQVRLALWCEARGLPSERLKHLERAIEIDPENATARGMLGHMKDGDRWSSTEEVAAKAAADAELAGKLAKYNGLRAEALKSAKSQFDLGRWCDSQGLKPEAIAHFTAATRIDPSYGRAWARLGFEKYRGRWMTREQIKAGLDEIVEQGKADRRWKPLLTQYRDWLKRPEKRAEVEAALSEIRDHRAVPAIARVFMNGDASEHERAARLIGVLDGAEATRHLAILAAFSQSEVARKNAAERLGERDAREVMEPLIAMLRDGLRYVATPSSSPGGGGTLVIEGNGVRLERHYEAAREGPRRNSKGEESDEPRNKGSRDGEARLRMDSDLAMVKRESEAITEWNSYAVEALQDYTGQRLGNDPEVWKSWWADQQGYTFTRPNVPLRTIVQVITVPSRLSTSCFAAGTPVLTPAGNRSIESLKVGDRVLAQDPRDGSLGYHPVVAVYHNPPSRTLRIRTEDDAIVATPIHRFWKAGEGWTLARDLKPGDSIRSVGRTCRVKSIEPDVVQPVFNLEVGRAASFFVGKTPVLVHDHSLVDPTIKPFDATSPGK